MISMIGIDHGRAPVDIRALFSFTKKNAGEAMEHVKEQEGVLGCVILSTCNRMELWISTARGCERDLYRQLCELKGIQDDSFRSYFVQRQEEDAVEHLFYLTSGLKSQILGEDQILTQVKDALTLAREHYTTDNVLEVLFRMAVTAGKKIKTNVAFSRGNPSVIHQAIQFLERENYTVRKKICMVIGNGEMGKMAAQTLREAGADVTVTVRQYRSGVVNIPVGCKRINYGERMAYLPQCDLVVSATASPNFTLREELFEEIVLEKPLVLIDLAVPRDIEPRIGERSDITLYDMDSFRLKETPKELEESLTQAGVIVKDQMVEFENWYSGKDLFPRIDEIKTEAVRDLNLRIHKIMRALPLSTEEQRELLESIDTAAEKVVNKMIFGLRESLEHQTFEECVAGLEKVYEE